MKKIIIMRHAKSDWNADYSQDFNRPLNNRGRLAAKKMGDFLQQKNIKPDNIICSSAVRTTQTLQLVLQQTNWQNIYPQYFDQLYLCGSRRALEFIADTCEDVETLMLINHQPTCGELVKILSNKWVEYATASIAIIHLNIEQWKDLTMSCGELIDFISPKSLN